MLQNSLTTYHPHGADQPRPWDLLLYDDHPSSTPQQGHRVGVWPHQADVPWQLQDRFQGTNLIHCWLCGCVEGTRGRQFKTNL